MSIFKINITIDKGFIKEQLGKVQLLAENQVRQMAEETEKVIRFNIQTSIKRPGSTANLANSFKAEQLTNLSWGVGNIQYLNQHAPYWRWINYGKAGTGRTIPPGTAENSKIRGGFTPGNTPPSIGSFQQGRFQLNGSYWMNPKKPIQAHNFIQRTVAQIPKIVNAVITREGL